LSTKQAGEAVIPAEVGRLVIAVAEQAFSDRDRLVEHFAHTDLRFVDVSDPDTLGQATAGAVGLVVTLQPLRSPHILALAPSVKAIGRAGVGLDTIDLEVAAQSGLTVINQPGYGTKEVASHAVGMLLALHRRLRHQDQFVRNGWSGRLVMSPMKPLDEMVVGLVGCGRIGFATAAMLTALVGEVFVYDPAGPEPPTGAVVVDGLPALLVRSDAVSLHLPLNAETANMVDASFLSAMKPGALFVNVSRGGLVDEAALLAALEQGQVGGAALDVFRAEPVPAESPLLRAENTLFSPHSASYSDRSGWRLASWTVGDTIQWAESETVTHGNIAVRGSR
jgi:D-3-phosphoglycerate dehydrogenase / 2-oxoglutarate reductase